MPPYAVVNAEGAPISYHATEQLAREGIEDLPNMGITGSGPGTKYDRWQVPGGENYHETLLTTPIQRDDYDDFTRQMMGKYGKDYPGNMTPEEFAERDRLYSTVNQNRFKSSHWDEPNVVVHTRANEREVPGLGRGRFLEEIQSDWHQQGKAKGYQGQHAPAIAAAEQKMREAYKALVATPVESDAFRQQLDEIGREPLGTSVLSDARMTTSELDAARAYNNAANEWGAVSRSDLSEVPDAPFKETWPDLALKREVLDVAERPDLDWLGFTGGKTQAERYDLSKQINEVHYSGTNLKAYDTNGDEAISATGVRPEDLPEYIGKEAAEKLLAQPPDGTLRSLSGVDLRVGGEGMAKFYDELLPKRLEKILKPFGGKVERGAVGGGRTVAGIDAEMDRLHAMGLPDDELSRRLSALQAERSAAQGGANDPMWFARLTPDMKQRIAKEGLPLMLLLLSQRMRPVPSHEGTR